MTEAWDHFADRMVTAIEARDADAFAAMFADDATAHHPLSPEPAVGREEIRALEAGIYESFSEIQIEVRSLVARGRKGALEVIVRATNSGPLDLGDGDPLPPTGRRIELPAVWMYDLGDDDMIVASRDYFDSATLAAQLGLDG